LELRHSYVDENNIELNLYEFRNPNLGNYSPIRTQVFSNAKEIIQWMIQPQTRLQDEIALTEPLEEADWVRGDLHSLRFERGGVWVDASSQGKSILLLPLEFSNALKLRDARGQLLENCRLVRGNLLLTAMVFEGRVQGDIRLECGPIHSQKDRRRDIEDNRRLGIVDEGEVPLPPDLHPHAFVRRP
jgi:hypothetical protein